MANPGGTTSALVLATGGRRFLFGYQRWGIRDFGLIAAAEFNDPKHEFERRLKC